MRSRMPRAALKTCAADRHVDAWLMRTWGSCRRSCALQKRNITHRRDARAPKDTHMFAAMWAP